MPYLGNSHVVGDHINNFKVLDDISSYTATFDGTATSVVSVADDTIRVPNHRFVQGQRIIYNNGGGSNISGLTSGTPYYIVFNSNTSFKLATSAANAANGVVVNILGVASSGTSHTINASFDGFNTRFKITHSSGKRARFINPSQLTIAVNNVVQRPNLDHSNFNEGFAIQHKEIIVFKNAPSVNEVFWGNLIGETIETFDISDLKVDNHTGDGSTQVFSLSRRVPNNESVMVSLDGVLQHPTDSTTERSYSTDGNLLTFVSAPANGVEIQIRHLGYAGAATGEVSGFYGRTGNVTITSSDHITTGDIASRNINVTGITTISQNLALNASGTTYPLVVHADADYKGIMVNGSYAPTIGFNILDNYTPSWKLGIHGSSHHNFALSTGTGNSNKLVVQGASNGGKGLFYGDWYATNLSMASTLYHDGDTDTGLTFGTDTINLHTGNVNRIVINNTSVRIPGNLVVDGVLTYDDVKNVDSIGIVTARNGIDCNGDLDVDGHTNLDNVSITGFTTVTDGRVRIISPTIANSLDSVTIQGGSSGMSGANDSYAKHGISFLANAYTSSNVTRTGAQIYMEKEGSWHQNHSSPSGYAYGALVFQTSEAPSGGTSNDRLYWLRERLRISAHGNVGIGISRPTSRLHVIGDGNITGVVTATAFKGDGTYLTGIAGFATALSLNPADPLNSIMYHDSVMGIGSTLTIDHPSSAAAAFTRFGDIRIDDDADLIIGSGDDFIHDVLGLNDFATIGGGSGDGRIRANRYTNRGANGAPIIENGANITGVVTATGADVNGDLDVDGHTNLDNVSVVGVTTFSEDVKFTGATSGRDITFDKSANYLRFNDNAFATFGNSDDLFIYHDGNHSQIRDVGAGHLLFGGSQIHLMNGAGNETYLKGVSNAQVDLYFNNSIKLSTTNTGVTVTGALIADQVGVGDNEAVYVGGSSDLQMYHDASGSVYGTANSSYIKVQGVHDNILDIFTASATGKIRLKSNNLAETMLVANGNGAVDLYFDNNLRFQTANYGVDIFGQSAAVSFGLYKTGGTKRGGLYATNGNVISLLDGQDHNILRGVKDGTAELYYDNVKRLETTSTGANVTGNFGASGNITLSGSFIMPDSLLHANDTTTRIRFPGPGTFAVDTSGNEVLRIASDANVRIIDGDLRVDTTGKGIIFGIEGGSNRPSIKGNYSSSSDNNMVFNTTGEERLRITGAGNVGINTSIPSATLEVSDIGSTGPLLLLNGASSTEGDICVDHDENLQIGHWNKSTSTFTERLSIPSSGYVQGNINVPCFFGEQDTAHSITNATWTKLVNFGNEPVNIGGAFTESTGVFTVGTGQAGTYVFYGGGGIDDIQDADYVEIVFVKNGSQIGPYSRTHCSAANHLTDAQLTFICSMSEGNTMELHIRHSEGSTEPTEPNRCFFGGYRLAV